MSLSRKLRAYSVAAGAAAIAAATPTRAVVQYYDHQADPIDASVNWYQPRVGYEIVPRDVVVLHMDGTYQYEDFEGGTSGPVPPGSKTADSVWFTYRTYNEQGAPKEGIQFETQNGSGIAAGFDGSTLSATMFGEDDIIGPGTSFFTDTDGDNGGTGAVVIRYGYPVFDGYAGFFIQEPDGPHYGYVNVYQPSTYSNQIDILGWAYETDPNTPILAGDQGDIIIEPPWPWPPLDAAFIDALRAAMTGPGVPLAPGDEIFDLDWDGDIDVDDMDLLVHNFVETDVGDGTEYGDFNLDGRVDTTDLTILATNFGMGSSWAEGNASTDFTINTTDLAILAEHFGFVAPVVVPEPMTLSLLALGAPGILAARRRKRAASPPRI